MKLKVAVMGATGLVGQRFISLLNDHPYFEVTSLYASKNSLGKKYKEACNWALEVDMPEYAKDMVLKSFEGNVKVEESVIFSALPTEVAATLEVELAKDGKFVFSNTSSHRYDRFVPILIPEVNADHLDAVKYQGTKGFIVTNANCSTTGLVIPLKALLEKFSFKYVFVVTMQAISGAGLKGLYAIDIQRNVIPYIEKEEEKIQIETKKILGKFDKEFKDIDLKVFTRANRVDVRDGHTEVVFIDLNESVEKVKSVFESFKGVPQNLNLKTAPKNPIIVFEENNHPQPVLDVNKGNGMSVSVGRLKEGEFFSFTILSHNTIRGAAGGSILNAELAYVRGLISWSLKKQL